jgi:hypothetical protein
VPVNVLHTTVPGNDVLNLISCLRPAAAPGGQYKVGIYVKQPTPNTWKTYNFNCPYMNLGFACLYIEKNDLSGAESIVIGYLPTATSLTVSNGMGQSSTAKLAACGGQNADVSFTYTATAAEYNQVLDNLLAYFSANPTYDLSTSNSVDFVLAATANLGLSLTPVTGVWPQGAGSTAGILGQNIRHLTPGPNLQVNGGAQFAPLASGNCFAELHTPF